MKHLFSIAFLVAAYLVVFGSSNPVEERHSAIPQDDVDQNTRIVTGVLAESGEFPFMCSLLNYKENGMLTVCGGSFITPHFILTAAHCVVNTIVSTAGCGTVDFAKPYVRITSHKFTPHPDYNPENLNNNIALWDSPIGLIFNEMVNPINLPSMSTPMCLNGEKVRLTGFGRNTTEAANYSRRLRFIDLRVISNTECEPVYGSDIVVPSTLCALGFEAEHHSSCDGDGGSPLFVEEDGVRTQIAVASFTHSSGCESGMPTGYVRVAPYLGWISNVTDLSIRH
ncbi:brachyurin-like [Culicoides brevitarsis]|uniref:brachyurin-like n=1 Tax=Culicoides brevitarsis TaxID=469753 RepID=UPI00307C2141